jgi:hypothetical protein
MHRHGTDAWYFDKKNMECVEGLGRDWVASQDARVTASSSCLEAGCPSQSSLHPERSEKPFQGGNDQNRELREAFLGICEERNDEGWRVRIVASYEKAGLSGEPKSSS